MQLGPDGQPEGTLILLVLASSSKAMANERYRSKRWPQCKSAVPSFSSQSQLFNWLLLFSSHLKAWHPANVSPNLQVQTIIDHIILDI